MTAYRTPARPHDDGAREAATRRGCKTCGSNRCGNHAACARRVDAARERCAAAARSAAGWWFQWSLVWLYVGAFAYLWILTQIEDGATRDAASRAAADGLTDQELLFVVTATSTNQDDVLRSARIASALIELGARGMSR